MRVYILIIFLAFSSTTYSSIRSSDLTAEIQFKYDIKKTTKFRVTRNKKKKIYKLIYIENTKVKSKPINEDQANRISQQLNRFFWLAKYRKPASNKKCTEYAQIKIQKKNTKLCAEDVKEYVLVSNLIMSLKSEF